MIWFWIQTLCSSIGLIAAFGFILSERKNHHLFEKSTSFKMKRINAKINEISIQTLKNKEKLAEIEEKNYHFSEKIQKNTEKLEEKPLKPHFFEEKTQKNEKKRVIPPLESEFFAPSDHYSQDYQEYEEPDYTDTIIKELMYHAVNTQNIEMFLQPIVRLPQRKIAYNETFARLRAKAGIYIPANQYRPLAIEDRLDQTLDSLLLERCLSAINTSKNGQNPFFININSSLLKNAEYMKPLLKFIAAHRHLTQHMILELQQNDYDNISESVNKILGGLGELGCRFSLDHVKNLTFDLKKMEKDKIEFIKIPAKILLEMEQELLDKLKKNIEDSKITLIAEKIETERSVIELNDLEINYGQGYLFGRPTLELGDSKKRAA